MIIVGPSWRASQTRIIYCPGAYVCPSLNLFCTVRGTATDHQKGLVTAEQLSKCLAQLHRQLGVNALVALQSHSFFTQLTICDKLKLHSQKQCLILHRKVSENLRQLLFYSCVSHGNALSPGTFWSHPVCRYVMFWPVCKSSCSTLFLDNFDQLTCWNNITDK